MVGRGCWTAFLRRVDSMRSEFVKGASWFAVKAVEALEELIECLGGEIKPSTLARAVDQIESINPSMAALSNVASIVRHYVSDPSKLPSVLTRLKEHVVMSTSLVAEVFTNRGYDFKYVMTLSYSGTVLELAREGLVERFVVLESRPGSEGIVMCSELNRYVRAEIVPDLMAREAMKGVDAVIVGADSICLDGYVINKLGTSVLASIAKELSKPFIVVADSLKAVQKPHTEVAIPVREYEVGTYVIKYPVFDVTPPDLVTDLVTDVGTYKLREGVSKEILKALLRKISEE